MGKNQAATSINVTGERMLAHRHVTVPSLHDPPAQSCPPAVIRDSTNRALPARTQPNRPARRFGYALDGHLPSWQDVATVEPWRDLLVGNGFSSHLWPAFSYRSLYAQASRAGILRSSDRELFAASFTENFERVLGSLAISIHALDTLGEPAADRLRIRYLRIQGALGAAVRAVHVPLGALPAGTRRAVRSTLRGYRWVFSTSYDLVIYWCAAFGDSFDGFTDLFFCNDRLEFDSAKTLVPPGATCLVYLHGALHLLVDGNGVARKRRSHGASLLEQFGEPDESDSLIRPLLVAEGTAREKSRLISDNAYLSFGLNQLRRGRSGLVVFGLSLRDEDAHLVSALNFRVKRPIAVGMRPQTRSENRRRQARIRALLDSDRVLFFDASTHPLGEPCLARSHPGQTQLIAACSDGHTPDASGGRAAGQPRDRTGWR